MKWRFTAGPWVLGLTAGLLTLAGCGDNDGSVGNNNNNNNHVLYTDSGTPQTDAATGNCNRSGYVPENELATYGNGDLLYQASNSAQLPSDSLRLEILSGWGGPTSPGSFTLENSPNDNYETCGLCPRMFSYTTTREEMDKQFYADTGTIEITSIGSIGGTLSATFHNVIFREVTLDTATWITTPVPGGEVWCIDGFTMSVPIEDAASACAQPGTCLGDTLNDFTLISCETGDPVSALSILGGNNALWLVGSHEW